MRKREHDIKHAKINIWKREIRPDHNVKSYLMKERRQRECLKSYDNEKQRKTNNFLDTGK